MTTYEVQCRYKGRTYSWSTITGSTITENDAITLAKKEQALYENYDFRVLKTETVVTKTVIFERND